MKLLKKRMLSFAATAFALAFLAPSGFAQAPAAAAPASGDASLHGHITNPAGIPLTGGGNVKLTTQTTGDPKDATFKYTFPISATADYSGKGIAPGSYVAYVVQADKFVDRLQVTLAAGDDKTLDFDMTREEYQKTLTPEEKKQIEDFKKKNAATTSANAVIANLNKTLTGVREDLKAATPNYDKDVADMKAAVAAKPEEGILWMTYGDALSSSADHMAADDRKQGKSPSDDAVTAKQYSDSVDAYKKGIDLNQTSKKPNPLDQATAYNQMGSALAHAGKVQDAQAAYEAGAKLVPASAGMYYSNEAAVLYNASQQNSALGDAALAAANKAIDADPDRADPYFVKAQILLQKATVDPKTQKVILPDGCEDAYQHYLSLDPNGKFAASVKEILAQLDIKINTSYRASNKKKK